MTFVSIWVDADSCPRMARRFILTYAAHHSLPVTFTANKKFEDTDGPFEMIVCDQTRDAADTYIAEHAASGDLVVTRDIPFAARLVQKEITVINDRGTSFTKDNIAQKLADREYDLNLTLIGLGGKKANTYGAKEFARFTACFEKEIARLIRNASLNAR